MYCTYKMAQSEEIYDLLIVADATSSMYRYLVSLHTSLPQIISISALTGCFSRIGLLCYRDYCDGEDLLEWHGWVEPSSSGASQPDLIAKVKTIRAHGGGDYPEAIKTALAKVYEVSSSDATTLVLLYTDAPPHTCWRSSPTSNFRPETRALSVPTSYGGYGSSFVDWVSAGNKLRHGEKKIQTFCILEHGMLGQDAGFYNYLCTMTGGACIYLENSDPGTISKVTIEVLLAWMGVEKAGDASKTVELPADISRYIDITNIESLQDENDPKARMFFDTSSPNIEPVLRNIAVKRITSEILREYLPKKKTPVTDFARSYTTDPQYRAMAVEHLRRIINDDVRAMSLNPVFGGLWRAVCNDRTLEERNGLISIFGLQIERIVDPDEKAQMRAWLEESYDYAAEIQELINSVPQEERFPCVCLDPTLSFARPDADVHDKNDDDDGESNKPLTAFRRDELLEIGRSCDYKILRRLGRILTRLTYIESVEDMPEHIAVDNNVRKIPMALAAQKYGRPFWKILLHAIVPGTMLSSRPAALLAALSLRMGVEPLTQVAEQEMLMWRDRWNDIDIPETWNVGCLSLLLDADAAYRRRHDISTETSSGLLTVNDRNLFEGLVAYKMLELNLETPLMARIGWTPEKSVVPIGPVAICRSCQYPRSVTIMGPGERCGHCLCKSYTSPDERTTCIHARVSKADNDLTPATWVECSIRTCRAQYVVYNVEALNVRSKCHYCRLQSSLPESERKDNPAPWVECTRCLNRIICPQAYRAELPKDFLCPACSSGPYETVTEIETTATKISAENTTSWLIQPTNPYLFTNRSTYHTISTLGTDIFLSQIRLFPPPLQTKNTPLTLNGKPIHNSGHLIQTLQNRISHRHGAERSPCSLCFSTFRPSDLHAACGRRGCFPRICRGCLSGWYGLNSAGRILNTAALSCPFCRRPPAARTLAKHGMGVHAVGDLARAVQDQGTWIYAWCQQCGFAKRYLERVCARGVPGDITGWTCEGCTEEIRQREIAQIEQTLRDDARLAGRNWQAVADAEARHRRALEKEAEKKKTITKPCPNCGTETEKIAGCDHITCPVAGCGTHWCYFCGKAFPERKIYGHMYEEHGTYFGGGGGGEGGEYYDDYDDYDDDEDD
jgi:hypothetical protein